MPEVTLLSNNMTGGEVSRRIWTRPDVTKVKNGLKTSENAIIITHGGAYKRPGTAFVVQLKNSLTHAFIPFQFSTEQSYTMLFGPNYIWFTKDQGIITHTKKDITAITNANPAVVTSAAHSHATGDYIYITGVGGMDEVNNRWFLITAIDANNYSLNGVDSSNYDAYTSGGQGGEIVEITTSYSVDELQTIQVTNINDVMYIAHGNHPLAKLSRTSDTNWTLAEPDITTGPFRSVNTDAGLLLTVSGFSDTATAYGTHIVGETLTISSSGDAFDPDQVGSIIRMYEEGGATGIVGAPIGNAGSAISNGGFYTYEGNVYGISDLVGSTNWGPFTRVPEHDSGAVKVSSSGASFNANFLHPGYCVVRILSYVSASEVTAEIVRYQMPRAIIESGTTFWQEGAWSTLRGFPNAITLYEQRLWLGGSTSDPTAIWSSRGGEYENFEGGPEDDDAITYRLSSGRADVIRWMFGRRLLTAGTSQGEYAISASNRNEAITPDNIKAVLQTDVGTSAVLPITINQAILYPQRRGDPDNNSEKLREYSYQFTDDAFSSVDITVFAEHIFGTGLRRLAYQREPESLIWALRDDGTLACCTYERDQESVPWHRHFVSGPDAKIKTISSKPGEEGDELWMQVNRTIGGETVGYTEVLTHRFRELQDAKEDCQNVDSSLVYSGDPIDVVTGLWHLRGQDVKVLADGSVFTSTISDTGKLTLDDPAAKIAVGYGYRTILHLQEFEAAVAQGNTRRSRKTRISNVALHVLDSLGGTVGTTEDNQADIEYRKEQHEMDASPPLQTAWFNVPIRGGWDESSSPMIIHDDPLPFFVTACVGEQSVSD